jgi:hypothetical protein
MIALFALLTFVVLLVASPKLKRMIFCLVGAGWLALTVSDYAFLTGQSTTYIPGKFTLSGRSYERVKCSYWIGLGGIRVHKAGSPYSISCPWTLYVKDKWNSPKYLMESAPPTVIVKEK